MNEVKNDYSIGDVDPGLLEEAFRRARSAARNEGVESSALLTAIITEARRGTRDLYGLVSAATRASAPTA